MTKSVWETLSAVDVKDHVEKKGKFNYLSWAWAWQKVKEYYPNARFEKHWFSMGEPPHQIPYAMDKKGHAFVKVTVEIEGQKITEVLAVLDHNNKSITNPSSQEVNTALQRCLTKAIGYAGLGFYLYAGEDLPIATSEPKKNVEWKRTHAKADLTDYHKKIEECQTPEEVEAVKDEYADCLDFAKDDIPDWHTSATENTRSAENKARY